MVETESWWRDPVCWALALWGALVAAAGFPPAALWPLAVLAPAPLFAASLNSSPRRAAVRGFLYGAGFFSALLWWIVPTVVRYGNLHLAVGIACLLGLAGCLALYPSAVAAGCALLAQWRPGWALVLAPLLWTGAEWARGKLLSGFPWGDLPQALWQVPVALDLAPWCGIDGVRLLLAALATLPVWCLSAAGGQLFGRRRLPPAALLPGAASALLVAWLGLNPAWEPLDPQTRVVGIAQGNIDQDQKWDPAFRRSSLQTYARLSLRAAVSKQGRAADLVVWPETAAPFYAQDAGPVRRRMSALARRLRGAILFGAPAYERSGTGTVYRNAVFLMGAEGELRGRYDKVHLVPFGEYVPFGRYLPFVKKLVQGAGDFTAGPVVAPLPASGDLPRLGPLVCFEVIFPEIAELHVRRGARLLTVVTNDGWFGTTPGPYQHLAFAAWRAAENGVPLVRAANTGISAVFDARGRLLRASELGREAAFAVPVTVSADQEMPQHALRRHIGPACLALAAGPIFVIFLSLRRQRRARKRRV